MNAIAKTDRTFSRFRLTGVTLLIVAAGAVGVLWAGKQRGLRQEPRSEGGARVRVVTAEPEGGSGLLSLQGEAQPFVSAILYPKVSGFLRRISVDKGSVVHQGQVLAVLESAETDRDAAALQADYDNKLRASERYRALARQGIVSTQALEDAESAALVAREKLASQSAIQGYQRVVAPFSGVITQRYADPGAMLQNGAATSTAQPVLAIAQVDRLRVVLYLDQQAAYRIKLGTPLEVHPADRPDQVRALKVARMAGAIDPKTRTLLVEADLENQDGAFLPGGAVVARLQVPPRSGTLRVPSEAVVLRENRPCLAVVTKDRKVSLRQVLLGDDTGIQVQVLQGLQTGEKVILSPPVTLKEGDPVEAVEIEGPRK